ncbi:MAG: hypothetical protein CME59_09130 [Halioglobus sp.]|nr:hypothetical protein [Halioglobus sp.]|tara:strand:+ start:2523 stop:3605 length:1083 start_codon:yes stop_codon:yes gene_type:complete
MQVIAVKVPLAVLVFVVLAGFGGSAWLSRPVVQGELDAAMLDGIAAAPLARALTLAKGRDGALWLVTSAQRDGITAVDVSAASGRPFEDALQAWTALGEAGLRALAGRNTHFLAWDELGLPLAARPAHIAAGTNFAAHAREVGHEDEPFLFPKLSSPTPWDAAVPARGRLDHEVELCAVTLDAHTTARPARLGYLLCGDFTDRWALVRDIDLDGPMGRSGFPGGKGGAGMLPVGPLLVIPAEEAFYRDIDLRLYVDGTLRQHASAANMIWSPREILQRALADCAPHYAIGAQRVRLTDCRAIAPGTLVLTGTPEGVLFKPLTIWNPWAYLRPGDEVTSIATYLGLMRNTVVAAGGVVAAP